MKRSKQIRIAIGTLLVLLVAGLFALDRWLEIRWAVGSAAILLGLLGWYEYARIAGIAAGGHWADRGTALAGAGAAAWFLGVAMTRGEDVSELGLVAGGLVVFLLVAFFLAVARGEPEVSLSRIGAALLGLVLFGLFYSWVIRIYVAGSAEEALVRGVVFFLGVKGTDIAAYLVGSSIGRHHFLKISPGKTLEGYVAALAWGASWFGACGAIFPEHLFGWFGGILLGILLAVASSLGDLTESLIKRHYRVKDSGALLPEFGGVLDLIDSFLFSAFLFWAFLS